MFFYSEGLKNRLNFEVKSKDTKLIYYTRVFYSCIYIIKEGSYFCNFTHIQVKRPKVVCFRAIIPSLDHFGSISNKIEEKVSISIVTKGSFKIKERSCKFLQHLWLQFLQNLKENIFPMKGTLNLNFFVAKIM